MTRAQPAFDWRHLLDQLQAQVVSGGIRIALMVVLMLLLLRSTRYVTDAVLSRTGATGQATEQQRRVGTLAGVVTAGLRFSIIAVGLTMMLREVGFDVGPLIASAGILGVAIGLGSQQVVRDVLNGFLIIVENQFRVGDSVKLGGCEGVVERMSMRTTWLRDLSGAVYVIPNSKIDVVANHTFDWARAVVEVGISYGANLDDAVSKLHEVLASMHQDPTLRNCLLDDGSVSCVERLDPDAVVLRLEVRTDALKQWSVQRELRRRVVEALTVDHHGVKGFTVPQAPPAHV